MLTQVLVHQDSRHLVTWIETDSRVKPGVQVELKGESGLWTVDKLYARVERSGINRNWNVGGL